MARLSRYSLVTARLIFACWYFGVGVLGLITNDPAKDAAEATTALEKAMAQSLFINPLLCLCCLAGGGALFFRRTAPLGIVLAPLVIIIFFFHLITTTGWWWWGSLNLIWLAGLAGVFRDGFYGLWNYAPAEPNARTSEGRRTLGTARAPDPTSTHQGTSGAMMAEPRKGSFQ